MTSAAAEAMALTRDQQIWLEMRDEQPYCKLCWAYATPGHIASAKHNRKYQWLKAQPNATQAMEEWTRSASGVLALGRWSPSRGRFR